MLDGTHRRVTDARCTADQDPFEIGGVRMSFVNNPDGMPVQFIERPHGARGTYEMRRGVRLQMGTAR
ncbi:lactoylglutathione lyase [Mycobacterium vulneris]|uniref:Lactoylglutathione lyase n=1 Tax=Mycolicibacterium vulneris TaxID=547163 RepID=A0A1X2KXB9_9MYCO|nr:lactoylglutathione lyase [Mycolicibacterium vulneris]OSC26378.1 lactoylglutathione lyase [Mycolicibacterium vulneris]